IKKALERLGVEVELKAVNASVYFSSDPMNPDTASHFYADMQSYATRSGLDPQWYMRQAVRQLGDRAKSEQLDGAEHRALGQRRVRSALAAGGDGTGSRQTRCALHPHERSGDRGCGGHPGVSASRHACNKPQPMGPGTGPPGLGSLESGVLVSRDLRAPVVI